MFRFADNMVAERTFGNNGDETSCMFPTLAKCRPAGGHGSIGRAAMIATNSYDQDPAGAVETNVAARCKIVVGFESISPARVSFHTRGVVRIFAIRKPVYGRQNRGQTHQIYMRRFTILRNRFPFEINELPPTSPPPSATYPFGFLSPASPSPEVHPAVGIMRMLASSRTVSAAQSHCFSTLRVSKLRASPSPLRGRLLTVPLCIRIVPGSRSSCHLRRHVRRVASLPNRLTRSAGRSASRTLSRPFADLRFRRPSGSTTQVFRNAAAPPPHRIRDAARPVPTLDRTFTRSPRPHGPQGRPSAARQALSSTAPRRHDDTVCCNKVTWDCEQKLDVL